MPLQSGKIHIFWAAQAVEQAVQAERAAMTVRLLTTFQSLKAMAQGGNAGQHMGNGSPAAAQQPHAQHEPCMRGAMATLLGVQPGQEPARRLGSEGVPSPMYTSRGAHAGEPFSAFASSVGALPDDVPGAGLLGSSLSSLLSSHAAPAANAAAPQPGFELRAAKSDGAKPFSFFNNGENGNIWS